MKKITLYVLGILAVLTLALIVISYDNAVKENYHKQLAEDIETNIGEVEGKITSEFLTYRRNLSFLFSTPPISGIARAENNEGIDPKDGTTTPLWKDRLGHIFTAFLENNLEYTQLRVIDLNGDEIVRAHRQGARVAVVPESHLQNKAHRYYFKTAITLSPEQIYTSTIDLNKEKNALTFPLEPTLRMAKPIYDDNGKIFGLLITNIDMSAMLKTIDELVPNYYEVVIIDSDGFFIKHSDPALVFSRDLAPDYTFDTVYSDINVVSHHIHEYRIANSGAKVIGEWKSFRVSSEINGLLKIFVSTSKNHYDQELLARRTDIYSAMGLIAVIAICAIGYFYQSSKRHQYYAHISKEAKATIDVTADSIVTLDGNLIVRSCNRAFELMFGIPTVNAIGAHIDDVFTAITPVSFSEKLQLFEKGKLLTNFNFSTLPDNTVEVKYYNCRISRLHTDASSNKFALVITDVTREAKAILALENANKELETTVQERTAELKEAHAKALEASNIKSQFISTISHEMRTPLNGIVGAVNLMQKEVTSTKLDDLLGIASTSVNALNQLVNDILDLSKIEAGKLELNYRNFSPEALIESITQSLAVVANEKQLQFYVDTAELLFTQINSDPHRLTQILNNLINNAIKFTNSGYIHVSVTSNVIKNTGWLHFDITDTGKGISTEDQSKLFQSFSQANNAIASEFGGTGLGLSICRQLLTLLGGSIDVESSEGNGSSFRFSIPTDSWELRDQLHAKRMQGLHTLIISENQQLVTVMTHLIESLSGSCEAYSYYPDITNTNADFTFIDSQHAKFDDTLSSASKGKNTQLGIIGLPPSLPDNINCINITTPVQRSSFLAAVFDERQPRNSSTQYHSRQSDSANKKQPVLASRAKLLLVDDNEINLQVARFILEEINAELHTAKNGQLALDMLNLHHGEGARFDCILMDCNMPVLNGYDATRAIRKGQAGEHYRDIPIIAMTANAMRGESVKCQQAGMNDYITKPVNPDILATKVTNWLLKLDKKPSTLTNNLQQPADHNTMADVEDTDQAIVLWNKTEALHRLSGKEALLKKLVTLLLNDIPKKLTTLDQCVNDENWEQVRQTAHALKGSAADVGATLLYQAAYELEKQAKNGESHACISSYDSLKHAATQTVDTLEVYLVE